MIGRLPLLATLLPLAAGITIWAFAWNGYRSDFVKDLQSLLPAGTSIDVSGFPYRMEADVAPLNVSLDQPALKGRVTAERMTVNRVPWQRDRQVISLGPSDAQLSLVPLAGASARITAPVAQASLRLADEQIARLSIMWENPAIAFGLLGAPLRAGHFEAHLRETPGAVAASGTNPRHPTQAQLMLNGKDLRIGEGAPLALEMQAELTATVPIDSFAGWKAEGTAEIVSLSLRDAISEVARIKATLVPDGKGALRIAGTIETICPQSMRAALAGTGPVSEKRARKAQLLPFSGSLPGGVTVAPATPAQLAAPVRGQEPPCPRIA